MSEKVHDAPVLCGVCKKGFLIPSGCGCNHAGCSNHVDKWKPATAGYEPPKKVDPPKAKVVAPEPTKTPEPAPVVAAGEPAPKKRGRPKKNP